jgi:predicted Zn-dependent protease
MIKWILALLLAMLSVTAYSFSINGSKWPGGATHLHVGIPGLAASGESWRNALRRAAQEWTDKTPFRFTVLDSYRDPCQGYRASGSGSGFPAGTGDDFNGADFSSTVCGNNYGTNVLAVALVYTESNQLGATDITEADIVFNSNSRFDIYDGPADGNRGTDFTRVALHELGHVIGMGHEQNATSIMRASIGNVFALQPDDIAGATTLYQGYTRCPVSRLDFGRVTGALAAGDCTVQQLLGGGSDNSQTDVYQFELAQSTRVTFNMNSATLDSVLVLMSNRSEVIEIDDDGGEGCNSQIVRTLSAGTYAVLANTVTSATGQSSCGSTSGPYELTARYDSASLIGVRRNTSLQGGSSAATFAGGVTTNGGTSYSNRVTPTQRFDVQGRITVDAAHRGRQGFLVTAAILENNEVYVRNSVGEFVALGGRASPVPVTTSKILGTTESVTILAQAVASQFGITNASVRFLIGYGLSSNPNELYFHDEPINLLVTP